MTNVSPSLYPMKRSCPFDPAPELVRLRAEGTVSKVTLWDGSTPWLVTGYEEQRAILSDPRISSDGRRPGFPHVSDAFAAAPIRTILRMDGSEHIRHRRYLIRDFMVRRVEAMRTRIQQIVDERIDEMLSEPRPADLVTAFALPVPSLVICELLGVPYRDHDFFQTCSHALVNASATPQELADAAAQMQRYLLQLVEDKRRHPTDDLIGRLAAQHLPDGDMSAEDIRDLALLVLVAGHETTASMIAMGTLALMENPEQMKMLRSISMDRRAVSRAVDELLRYLNIAHTGRRRIATEDVEIGGVTIRAGEGVIAANDIGNRDARVFADPDTLDISRDARAHVAFGYGPHQCVGQTLARVELQVVYGTLYRRIPTLRLAVPFEDIEYKDEMVGFSVRELPVVW